MYRQAALPAFLLALLLATVPRAGAQERFQVAGVILDSVTGAPLPYARVLLENTTLGTVSNEEGDFTLEVPGVFAGSRLQVAYLGYKTRTVPASRLSGVGHTILLSPATLELAEVEIVALTPEEVIRRTVAAIPANFGTDSLILTAFIRSQKFMGGKLVEFTEAIVGDLKTGYGPYEPRAGKKHKRVSNLTQLIRGRVISDTVRVELLGEVGRNAGCLGCNFIRDVAEFYRNTVLDESCFAGYTFRMKEEAGPEGERLYHIFFDQKQGSKERLWQGDVYVDAREFALVRFTQRPSYEGFEPYEKQKFRKRYRLAGSEGWIAEMPELEQTVTYARRGGAWYLNTIQIRNRVTFTHPATGKQIRFGHRNEVVVTEATRDKEKLKTFRGDQYTGVNQRWDQVVGKSDDLFWAGFNYLPVEKQLEESLQQMDHRR